MQEIRKVVASEFDIVNQLIVDQLHSKVPLVENIGHYIIDAGGKRMRPTLALLTGGACGNLTSQHHTLAAIIEFIHTATLLHDDVVDLSTLRRGRATANAEWGNAPSVLVGDFLYSRAFQLLVEVGSLEVMQLMADATNTIAEGEVLQLTKAGNPSTSEQDYFQVINDKTAVLFAAASAGGAILANADKATVEQYYQYGLNVGLAFQLIDDVLDYEGDAEEMGKNVGDDLAEGKCTLPLIHAMQHGDPAQTDIIKDAITHKNGERIDEIIAIVRQTGAIEHTRQQALEASNKAIKCLTDIQESSHKEALLRLAGLAINRTA
jgi:octaprenyl-diphosphate synthase